MSDEDILNRLSELETRVEKLEGKTALDFDWKSEVGVVPGIMVVGLGLLVYHTYLA